MNNNQVILIGRPTFIGEIQDDKISVGLSVEIAGQEPELVPIEIYGRQAQIFSDYVLVGTLVSVTGALRKKPKGPGHYVQAESFQMMGRKK